MSSSHQVRFIEECRDFVDLEHARRRFVSLRPCAGYGVADLVQEIKRKVKFVDPYPIANGSRGDVYEAYLDNHKVSLLLLVLVSSWQVAT